MGFSQRTQQLPNCSSRSDTPPVSSAKTIFNLRRDPFERADFNSNTYWDWLVDHAPYLYLAQAIVQRQIEDFVKFRPRQKAASFNLDAVMAALGPAMAAHKAKDVQAEKHQPELTTRKAG